MDEVERERMQEIANTYAVMKQPWLQLRALPVGEIAKMLSLMEPAGCQDTGHGHQGSGTTSRHHQHPSLARAWISRASATRQAPALYNFMKAKQVLPYLRDSSPQEAARILMAMDAKKRAALKEAIFREDEARSLAIDRAMRELDALGVGAEGHVTLTRLGSEPLLVNAMQIESVEAGTDPRTSQRQAALRQRDARRTRRPGRRLVPGLRQRGWRGRLWISQP